MCPIIKVFLWFIEYRIDLFFYLWYNVKKELEDTKEFEKVSPEEKTIDEALNGGKDISADEDNDIFNLIDSMYEGDE